MDDLFHDLVNTNIIDYLFGFKVKRKYGFKKRKFKLYEKRGELINNLSLAYMLYPVTTRTLLRFLLKKRSK